MIKTMTFVQRVWHEALGVDEVVMTIRYRVRNVCASPTPDRKLVHHAGFRDLPLFRWRAKPPTHRVLTRPPLQPMRPAELRCLAGDALREISPSPPIFPGVKPSRKSKRSIHPKKVTLAERASWVQRERQMGQQWDVGRPTSSCDCRGDKRCPGCGHQVAMRIQEGHIMCPDCHAVVGYMNGRRGDDDWYWAKAGLPGVHTSPVTIPQHVLNRCRPCPWVRCREHLYLEVDSGCGSMKLNHVKVPADQMELLPDTCALDVAEREEGRVGFEPKLLPLEVVGRHLGLTLERARQLEAEALGEMQFRMKRREKREAG